MTEGVYEALKKQAVWQSQRRIEGPLVFTNLQGRPIVSSTLERHYKTCLRACGLSEALHFHDLRHSAASLMLRSGLNLKASRRFWATPTSPRPAICIAM
jgi:site-specific recombinase XerD